MATKKQIEANRRNAKKSTGPKSPEGKAVVAQNSAKHGLCGDFCVLSFEDQQKFDELLAQFRRDAKPAGSLEEELVLKMARHTWMSNRAIRLQQACFLVKEPTAPEPKAAGAKGVSVRTDLELYIRYQVQNDRAYQRAAKELREHRKEMRLAEIGSASQKHKQAAEQRTANRETRLQEVHKTAAAVSQEKLQQMKLQTVLLEDKVFRSQNRKESLTNSDSATYIPATATVTK